MKKLLALIFILAVAAVFLAGCTESMALQETQEADFIEQPTPKCEYTAMRYAGIDVNPQYDYMSYYVDDDSAFVAEIWDAVRYAEWTERSESGQANVDIEFTFYNDDGSSLTLCVDPNDVGALLHPDIPFTVYDDGVIMKTPPHYFDVPAGTYKTLSEMLIDYSSEDYIID